MMSRTGSDWTDDEIIILENMWRQGSADKEIATKFGRSERAVTSKRQKLGLFRREPPYRKPTIVMVLSDRPIGWLDGAWFGGSAPLTIPTHETWRTLSTHRMAIGVTQDE